MKKLILGLVTLLVFAGAGCAKVSTPATNNGVSSGTPITLTQGTPVKFADGLEATLITIDDSRCPVGVQCIWAGELSAVIRFTGGHLTTDSEVRLGTTTKPKETLDIYAINLVDATTTTATISVTSKE